MTVTKLFFETFGIEHAVTSPYHPQSNGQDERSSQNIKRHLARDGLTNGPVLCSFFLKGADVDHTLEVVVPRFAT